VEIGTALCIIQPLTSREGPNSQAPDEKTFFPLIFVSERAGKRYSKRDDTFVKTLVQDLTSRAKIKSSSASEVDPILNLGN